MGIDGALFSTGAGVYSALGARRSAFGRKAELEIASVRTILKADRSGLCGRQAAALQLLRSVGKG